MRVPSMLTVVALGAALLLTPQGAPAAATNTTTNTAATTSMATPTATLTARPAGVAPHVSQCQPVPLATVGQPAPIQVSDLTQERCFAITVTSLGYHVLQNTTHPFGSRPFVELYSPGNAQMAHIDEGPHAIYLVETGVYRLVVKPLAYLGPANASIGLYDIMGTTGDTCPPLSTSWGSAPWEVSLPDARIDCREVSVDEGSIITPNIAVAKGTTRFLRPVVLTLSARDFPRCEKVTRYGPCRYLNAGTVRVFAVPNVIGSASAWVSFADVTSTSTCPTTPPAQPGPLPSSATARLGQQCWRFTAEHTGVHRLAHVDSPELSFWVYDLSGVDWAPVGWEGADLHLTAGRTYLVRSHQSSTSGPTSYTFAFGIFDMASLAGCTSLPTAARGDTVTLTTSLSGRASQCLDLAVTGDALRVNWKSVNGVWRSTDVSHNVVMAGAAGSPSCVPGGDPIPCLDTSGPFRFLVTPVASVGGLTTYEGRPEQQIADTPIPEPSAVNRCGRANDSLTIPSGAPEGIGYRVSTAAGSRVLAPGTYRPAPISVPLGQGEEGSATVTAAPLRGYYLKYYGASAASWYLLDGASVFTDVAEDMLFTDDMCWMHERGISTGYGTAPNLTYRPLSAVNRDAMAAFLYRIAGRPDVRLPARSPFADVSPSNPFYREIIWAYQRQISTGWLVNGVRLFRPLQPIARDAMAAFLYRVAGRPDFTPPAVSPFADVTASTAYYREMSWLYSAGVSTGWVTGSTRTYRPLGLVTRDAMAAFLHRFDVNNLL